MDGSWKDVPCKETVWWRDHHGYGQRTIRDADGVRRTHKAHRDTWQAENGPIPAGHEIAHHCDNPPCIEIAHLFLATHVENMADMVAKGRARNVPQYGADNWNTVVTDDQVIEIRERYAKGERQQALADEYGISRPNVSMIVSGATRSGAGGPITRNGHSRYLERGK